MTDIWLLGRLVPDGNAMLMKLNKGKTAVHRCHCRGDMAVRMCEVLVICGAE